MPGIGRTAPNKSAVPAYSNQRLQVTFALSVGKGFGENWHVTLQTMNLTNQRFRLDSPIDLAGRSSLNRDRSYVDLRYRFHYRVGSRGTIGHTRGTKISCLGLMKRSGMKAESE